ncbi:winged helix-turn-helix domain-containing protein [Halovenus salina]|uniref:winged helix-turn-helix domain-containing protein n=1 Tax=Halovenus salina TaxID=1510225 RepID=UPI002260CE35|nr:helix-turn-helix domain-containing protein [Halovenus salina]
MTPAPPDSPGQTAGGETADAPPAAETGPTTAAAFQQLGNETRVDIVRRLHAEGPSSFSALFDGSDSNSSAGFAYHLRELDGFVRQREDERWELTGAGQAAARAVASEQFTRSVDTESVSLGTSCPLCREGALTLAVSDGVADVTCSGCGESVTRLSFPTGVEVRDEQDLPAALDSYHRNRIRSFVEGVCPDCGGPVELTPETADDRSAVQFSCDCSRCRAGVDCPATLAVIDHAAVVSFYDDHGQDVTERPLWNVGPEWRERLLSTDPWCLLVSTQLEGDLLELYVRADGTVHDHRRRDGDTATQRETTDIGDDAAA